MRLGLGEFEESDDYSREFTRIRFLVVAEKIEPKILSEASSEPFTLFQEFVNRVPDGERDALWNGLNDSWKSIESSPRATEFLDSLWRWARRWNLEADWCIDRTILALRRERIALLLWILSHFSLLSFRKRGQGMFAKFIVIPIESQRYYVSTHMARAVG